jgi:tol-pal system protein YbgF
MAATMANTPRLLLAREARGAREARAISVSCPVASDKAHKAERRKVEARRAGDADVGNDLANAQQREKDLYADIEKRLSKLEPRRQTIDGVDHEVTQGEQKLFDEATASLKKKDFAAATQGFLSFLQRFPGSGYTAQAYYFLGSSYFAEGDCKNAMPALQTVINRFPLSQRAPDAMLNLAICQDDLNDKSAARDTLEALIKKYPASSAATNAKSRLGTLK